MLQQNDFEVPVRIASVRFEGVAHTDAQLLGVYSRRLLAATSPFYRVVQPLAEADVTGRDRHILPFGQVAMLAHESADRLFRLGIFKHVDVELDSQTKGEVDVVFKVQEVSRLFARTGTELGNNEGSMNAAIKIRNALGNAESLEANMSYGVETDSALYDAKPFTSQLGSSFQFLFTRPWNADPDKMFTLNAFKQNKSMNLYSSYSEQITGLAAKFKTFDYFLGATHEVAYEASWRRLFDLGRNASPTIRKDAGNSLKSSVSYTAILDHRDDTMLPTRGVYVRSLLEGAGLGGDVRHLKADTEGQISFPLGHGFSISSSLRSGILWTLGLRQSRVNDRFLLGGPSSIRGFLQNGVGPKDGVDVVGGDLFTSAGVSLFAPLPYLADKPIKFHFFGNAGNLIKLDDSRDLGAAAHKLFSSVSSSVGLGLAVRFSILRLEINYCLPITVTRTDSVKPGLQFGVGLQFS
ncbi:surface antigen-domain-containing protein [Chytriomyces sp. MP71]|nr:surface antigen-domain-containing protein [Chytriomyces sp. MP71]